MHTYRTLPRLEPGAVVAARSLLTVAGVPVSLPDPDRLTHLQVRRFAGCPVCNLHLRSFARRHDEIVAAGIREVVVFHSPPDELRRHADGLPFTLVADPEKRLYAEFGVESGARALLAPRVWLPIVRAVSVSLWAILRGQGRLPATNPHGGRLGLPADFLIASTGQIIACKYGEHADDQWSVDELLSLARTSPALAGHAAR